MVAESEKRPGFGVVCLENRQEQIDEMQKIRPALGMHRKGQTMPVRRAVGGTRKRPPDHVFPAGDAIDKLMTVTALSPA
ncbi:MAG: hypothetical protein HKP56_17635 [Anderseniella sp.]|nr:hypothetical protein [Anderseniella sp.]